MNIKEKVMGISKTKKMMLVAIVILAAGGVTGGIAYAKHTEQKLIEAQAMVDKEHSSLITLEEEIQSLFDEKDSAFLAEGVTREQIIKLKTAVSSVEKNYSLLDVDVKQLDTEDFSVTMTTAEDQLTNAAEKIVLQDAVNDLFSAKDKVAIKGSTVTKDLAIADGVNEDSIKSVKEIATEYEASFYEAVSDLVSAAETQVKQISTAKKAVEKVYKDKKVISTDSKLYDAAKKEVDKIKNATSKKSMSDQLVTVKKDIDKKTAEKKAAEEKKKQETAQAEQAQAAEGTTTNANQVAATDQAQAAAGVDSAQSYAPATGNDYSNNYASAGADQGYSGNDYYGNNNDYAAQPTTPAPSAPNTPAAPSTPVTPSTPQAPAGGSGGSGSGGGNQIVVNPEDVQGSESNNNGGDDFWWGW